MKIFAATLLALLSIGLLGCPEDKPAAAPDKPKDTPAASPGSSAAPAKASAAPSEGGW